VRDYETILSDPAQKAMKAMKLCKPCGKENPDDYKFCMRCGQLLAQSTMAVPTAAAPAITRSAAAERQIATEPAKRGDNFHEAPSPAQPNPFPVQNTNKLEQHGSKLTSQQKLYFQQEYDKQSRNPSTALILTLLLGGAGAHRFYLRQWGWGAAYILFAWTFIPVCVALVECFFIRARTESYNKQVAQQILDKMNIIFSEPEIAMAARAST
jgi:TM2 domain-containing membrane protein YozV